MPLVTQGCIGAGGKDSAVALIICGCTEGILGVASYGTSQRGLGGGQRWAIRAALGLPVSAASTFPWITHPASKQLHPLAPEAALRFSPLGYHAKEETSAQEEGFGQVQREGLWGMESPLKRGLDGDCLTQIFPFQKYARSSKAPVSCRHGCDRVAKKTETKTQLPLHSEKSQTYAWPASRG